MININSRTIVPLTWIYVTVTAATMVMFFQLFQNALKEDGLKDQLGLAFRNIETGATLHNVINNNAYHANYYLNKQMSALQAMAPGRYLEAKIIAEENGSKNKMGAYVDTYAHWMSKYSMLPTACLKTYDRFYPNTDSLSLFDFRVFITVDDCYPTDLGSREISFLGIGLFVFCLLLIFPFRILGDVFKSLRRIEGLMGVRDSSIVESVAKEIQIEEIRTLFLRASTVQGESAFHYSSVMMDVKHNVLRIILHLEDAFMRIESLIACSARSPSTTSILDPLASIASDIKTQLKQLRTASSHLESKFAKTPVREFLTPKHFTDKVASILGLSSIESDLPEANIHLDFEHLEPALLNISSNVKAHGSHAKAVISAAENRISVVVMSQISLSRAIALYAAKWTYRIDTETPDKGVYKKLIGREGLGLNMVKKSAFALHGRMILRWNFQTIWVGVDFPVKFSQIVVGVKKRKISTTKKPSGFTEIIICLKNQENIAEAEKLGLAKFLKSEENLKDAINQSKVQEIIVDHEVDLGQATFAKVRRIKNKFLLHGIAQNLNTKDEI